eukprot:TRINITY_DN779950_c0_g1_i1.p1 TRINITY_DN779950_c0_g1~~TRINITY_DN779950_c0_g1_i1.p1  ORF type:complete len:177 (-),score=17.19 TRINITY_DN779950_c0_g1_i1:111-641(-)
MESNQIDQDIIVVVLGCLLERLVQAQDDIKPDKRQPCRFDGHRPAKITIKAYLERLKTFTKCSSTCFVLCLVYIDRLITQSNFFLSSLNVHRVLVTSLMLAAKFFDDEYFVQSHYAEIGGISRDDINDLEVDFLFKINFSLHVTPAEFSRYLGELMKHYETAHKCDCAALRKIYMK